MRPRVQIPGPRPFSEFRSVRYNLTKDAPSRRRVTAVTQIFWKNSVAAARLRVVRNPRLNSRIVAVQPIYQHAQGPGPCVASLRKSKRDDGDRHARNSTVRLLSARRSLDKLADLFLDGGAEPL